MAQLQELVEGEQENVWGTIVKGNFQALNGELIATTDKVNKAPSIVQAQAMANTARDQAIAATTTPAQATAIANTARDQAIAAVPSASAVAAAAAQAKNDAIAASEPRIPRGTAATGSSVVLGTNGNLTFGAAPGGGTGGATDPEVVRDTVAAALRGAGPISIVTDDPNDTITISSAATVNQTDAYLLTRANHTGPLPLTALADDLITEVKLAPAVRSKLNTVATGGAAVRIYEDGPIFSGAIPTTGSLLDVPVRIGDTATIQTFEIRMYPVPASGSATFNFKRTNSAGATTVVATVNVGTTGVGRPSPSVTAAFEDGDLLDITCTANTTNVTTGTIVAMIDSRVAPATASAVSAASATGFSDTFTRPDSTTTPGATETGSQTWTGTRTWGISSNRLYQVTMAENGDLVADSKKINHKITAKVTNPTPSSNIVRLLTSYVDAGSFYRVEVLSSGAMSVQVVENYGGTTLTSVAAGAVTFDVTNFTIAMERINGNQFRVYINGTLVPGLTTDALQTKFSTATKCGVSVSQYGSGPVYFDDITAV